MQQPVRIILVDDHELVRESWKFLLDSDLRFSVIATCKDGPEVITQVSALLPDIVLMDINRSPMSGFDIAPLLLQAVPSVKIIGVSANNSPQYAKKLLGLGAKGFVTKTSPLEELKQAILEVLSGNTYVCEEIRKKE
jgi:DNA-binding NarL/FixJ family response regulator